MMEVKVTQAALFSALKQVIGASDAKATGQNVLSHVRLETRKATLALACTNRDEVIETEIGANVIRPGATTLPVRTLREWVGQVPGESAISLVLNPQTETTTVIAWAGKRQLKSSILGIKADEFPAFPAIPEEQNFTLNAGLLASALDTTLMVFPHREQRPTLHGVVIRSEPERWCFASSDGWRFAEYCLPCEGTLEHELIVPHEALKHVRELLTDPEAEVRIGATRQVVTFQIGHTLVLANQIAGNYPDYRRQRPSSTPTEVNVYSEDFRKAVRRAQIFTNWYNGGIWLDITAPEPGDTAPGTLRVRAKDPMLGDIEILLDAHVQGESMTFAANYHFIAEALGVFKSERTRLGCLSASSPFELKPEDDDNTIVVSMPMTIKN